jgi:uncharacterized protein DUF3568
MSRTSLVSAGAALVVTAGCVVAAVGAGAGGGIYFTERGVESVVPVSIDRAAGGAKRAFADLKIRQTKTNSQQDADGSAKQELDGTTSERDVTVTLKSEGQNSTRVQVVAKKSAVTWDKDFARAILDKIVAYSR